MDSPSLPHSTLLDALAFDLTIDDSTESESGGGESEVPGLPAIAQSRSPVLPSQTVAVRAQPGVGSGRFAVLAGDEQEDDSHFDIAIVIDPTAVDSGRSQIPEESGPTPHRPIQGGVDEPRSPRGTSQSQSAK